MFLNLGINAIEARSEAPLKLRYSVVESDDSLWEVSVSDNGVGMDSATRERIFHAFFSTKAREGELGLALVERIVHGHEGSISVESVVGRGSCFCVSLPRHARISGERRGSNETQRPTQLVIGV